MKDQDFKDVLDQHGDAAYRMAYYLTRGNEALARDLVQDAFVKIWRDWSWRRPNDFASWLYRILHNLYMDYLRRVAREPLSTLEVHSPSESDLTGDEFAAKEPLPLEALEKEEREALVHEALNRLPEEFRTPLILCDMEGLPYEEIAHILSCPVGTVRSRIHRGRRLLRASLGHFLEPENEPLKEAIAL